jgi:hypothetical protein
VRARTDHRRLRADSGFMTFETALVALAMVLAVLQLTGGL